MPSVCLVVVAAALAAPAASAHVGVPPSVLDAGPYRVVISAGPVAAPRGSALAFRADVTTRSSRVPLGGATVQIDVSGRAGSPHGTYRATGYDGVYSLLVPIPGANGWRSLHYTVVVDGRLGTFSARYVPPSLLDEWSLDPSVLLLAAVAAALFLQGFVRLRLRGRSDRAPFGRLVLFAAGLALIVLALASPVDAVGDRYLLSAHMLQHVLIGDAGPALIVLAVRGPLIFFTLPRGVLRVLGRTAWVRRAGAWLIQPKVALVAWALAYGGWHVPAAYDFAATHQLAHDIEHASFVVAGFLVWTVLIDPAGRGHLSRGQRLGVAAAVFAMGTVIADVLIFSLHPLYPTYASQIERVFGLSPLRDQQLAGLVMIVEQTLMLGTFAAVMLMPTLRGRRARRELVSGRERLA